MKMEVLRCNIDACVNCLLCGDVCEVGGIVHTVRDGMKIHNTRCDFCGECLKVCRENALKIKVVPAEIRENWLDFLSL